MRRDKLQRHTHVREASSWVAVAFNMALDADAMDMLPSHVSMSASGSVKCQVTYIPQTMKFYRRGSRLYICPYSMQDSPVPFEEFVSSLNLGDPPRNALAPEEGMDKVQVKQGSPMKAPRRKPKAPPGFTPPDISAAKEAASQGEAAANGVQPTTEAAGTLFRGCCISQSSSTSCQNVATCRHVPFERMTRLRHHPEVGRSCGL